MAKKKTITKQKAKQMPAVQTTLPQNILSMGERVEEDINIYISQSVYRQIHKFTRNKTTDESGGVLVGSVVEALGKTNLLIEGFVEGKFCEATPTTLTFTHETWAYIHKEIDKRYAGKKILGWIHTHPNFGIFLSEYDKFIHQNFFSAPTQVAYVVDPIQHIEGFYFWINGKLEKCKGFYIYDKTGTRITVQPSKDGAVSESERQSRFHFQNLAISVLSLAIAILLVMNFSLQSDLQKLQSQQQQLANSTSQVVFFLQQQIGTLTQEVKTLREKLDVATKTPENDPSQPTDPTGGTDADE